MKILKTIFLNPFAISFLLLLSVVFSFLNKNIILAEKLIVYLWVSLLVISLVFVFDYLRNKFSLSLNFLDKIEGIYHKNKRIIHIGFWLIGILIVLFSGFNKEYYLGGDDTRLFYVYPLSYLNNFSFKVISDNATSGLLGFLPPSVTVCFVVLLSVIKFLLPWANIQSVLYSLNLLLGFSFFYLMLGYMYQEDFKYSFIFKVVCSLFYIFSIFNVYTLYNSKLIAIYHLSVLPLSIYLIIKGVVEKKFHLIALLVLIWTTFSVFAITTPWFWGGMLVVIPIFILKLKDSKMTALKYALSGSALFLLLNLHWLIFLPFTWLSGTSDIAQNSLTSLEYRKINSEGIYSTANINTVFYPLFNSFHRAIQENFNWPYRAIYTQWYLKMLPLNALFVGVLVSSFYFFKNGTRKLKVNYLAIMGSFILAIYFFTVNVGNWGISFFIFLNNHLPGFVIFRNMYDKFGLGLSLIFALLLYVCIASLSVKVRTVYMKILCLFVVFVVLINAKPFLLGEFDKLPIWTTQHTYGNIQELNSDYKDLIEYIKEKPTAYKYLSVPLAQGNISLIQDNNRTDHFYNGVSPLLIMSGHNDFSGYLSFVGYSTKVQSALDNERYEEFAYVLKELNVGYIIENHSLSNELKGSYLYGSSLYGQQQNEEYKKILYGNKIKDFGERYSLYEINSKFHSEKIYLTDEVNAFPEEFVNLEYSKVDSHLYEIKVKNLNSKKFLVFLDPFFPSWKLTTRSGREIPVKQIKPFGYANGWQLDTNEIKKHLNSSDYTVNSDGSLSFDLILKFPPQNLLKPTLYLTLVTALSIIAYVILKTIKK